MSKDDKWVKDHTDRADYGDVPSGKGYDFDVSRLTPGTQNALAERGEQVKKDKAARADKAKEKQKTGL